MSLHKSHFLLDLIHQVRAHLQGELSLQRTLDSSQKDRLESQLRELREELRNTTHSNELRCK